MSQADTPRPGRLGRLADAIVARAFRALFATLAWVPQHALLRFGRSAADLCTAAGLRRQVLRSNLDLVYGESLTAAEKALIARSATRNLFLSVLEAMRVSHRHPRAREEILAGVSFEPPDLYAELCTEGKGFVVVMSHSGNFDMCGLRFIQQSRRRLTVVMKPARGRPFNTALVEGRRRLGFDVMNMRQPGLLRTLIRRARQGEVVCMLPDQHARRSGVDTTFLGQRARTHRGPAFVALKSPEARILVAVGTRIADGSRHVCQLREIDDFEPTGDLRADVQALTQRMNDVMAETLEKHPGSYLWHHRRWRGYAPERLRQNAPEPASSVASTP